MSTDIGDIAAGTIGVPRRIALLGGAVLLFVGGVWLINRGKGVNAGVNPAPGTVALDSGNGNVLILPASALAGIQNALLNGPGSPFILDSNTSPSGGSTSASSGNNNPPGKTTYKPGDTYPAHGQTLNQLAAKFGDTADHVYYANGNEWVISFLTAANPPGGGFTKRGTVGITGAVHIPHTSKAFSE